MNSTAEFPSRELIALPLSASDRYNVRLARGAEEIRAAQRLRFQVFNLELGEGLDASYQTGLDRDSFDHICDHIVVFHSESGELAGTYRIQTGSAAASGRGYYSAQEFDFSVFEPLRGKMIEIGRACIHRHHRNPAALGLLWKGIALYAQEREGRYLIGCSSLPTFEPNAGWSVYNKLSQRHLSPPERRTRPLPGWECLPDGSPSDPFPVPKLMQAYLGLGAEICGPPALDRQFGTIDFLTLLDLEAIHPAAKRRFFG